MDGSRVATRHVGQPEGEVVMCSIDLEPCDLWVETERRARKPHRCSCCGGVIAAGARYTVHFSKFEGAMTSQKMCAPCREAREEFAEAHFGAGFAGDAYIPQPGYLPQALAECIADGDEESERQWKPMLTAIRARGAGA